MIPDREGEARPPLTLEFAFVLALLAPLAHMVCVLLLSLIGFRGAVPVIGMGAVLAYAGIFTLCAVRFRRPPLEELALVRAPASAWLAVLFLLASVVLSSEIDNWVKAFFPVPTEAVASGEVVEAPPFMGATLAVVELAVFPLAYELFFRGILQPLAVARIGVVPGVLLTAMFAAVASGLVFAGLWGVAPAFASALVLGVLRQASGSLWPPLALHALMGLVTLGAQYQLFGLAGFDDTSAAHTPLDWVAGAAVLTAVGFGLLLRAARAQAEAASGAGGNAR
jgi:membrane protease YdiL (CAAX protease family)